jgi:hypothetical protein
MSGISTGGSVAGKANVDSGYNLQVALPLTESLVGSVRLMSENDPGTITGVPYLKSPETSSDYRLRVGTDTVVFSDEFTATTQNTDKWAYTFVTMTAAQPGAGTLNFGAVQGTANTHGAFMRTFQYFPLINTSPLAIEFLTGQFTSTLTTDEIWLMGIGLPSAAVTRPADGVWFKITSAGLIGVQAYSGVETESGVLLPFASMPLNQVQKFLIVIGEREIEWWVDDVKLTTSSIPSGNGAPFQGASAPIFMQKYCTGAVSNTNTMRVARVGCSLMDIMLNKTAPEIACTQGKTSAMGQNGHTMAATAGNVTNASIIPAGSAGSNTVANITGLGGIGSINAQAGSLLGSVDNIATSFQNPVSTINITGRNLIISGINIYAANLGATVATTPTTLIWNVAYGHTAVSLNTAETGSFVTATTHAPRRVPLGMMSVPIGAVVGATYDTEICRQLATPLVIRPGEFFATTVRFLVGTATALQVVTYVVGIEGYWE